MTEAEQLIEELKPLLERYTVTNLRKDLGNLAKWIRLEASEGRPLSRNPLVKQFISIMKGSPTDSTLTKLDKVAQRKSDELQQYSWGVEFARILNNLKTGRYMLDDKRELFGSGSEVELFFKKFQGAVA